MLSHVEQLRKELAALIAGLKTDLSMSLSDVQVPLVKQKDQIIAKFGHGMKPKDSEIYYAARSYVRGRIGAEEDYLHDLVGFALFHPVKEAGGETVAANEARLATLLDRYAADAKNGDLWEMTWFGVMLSYFHAPLTDGQQRDAIHAVREKIRAFLADSWPRMLSSASYRPVWMKVIEANPHLLTTDPCGLFAKEWLEGHEERINQISADLQIADTSWFWHELVLSCIKEVTSASDQVFTANIPKLLGLLKKRPGFLDEGLRAILSRYHRCSDRPSHEELKEFAISHWKNPKLRHIGGSKWLQVEEPVWQMVMGWVNEANLRLFFEVLSARHKADEGRLDFWLKYINQVTWTKLIFGPETNRLRRQDPEIAKLFEFEQGTFAYLDHPQDDLVDAFMMRIGDYLIVEFSRTNNGCYIYEVGKHGFNPDATRFSAGTYRGGLKERYSINRAPDIRHVGHPVQWHPRAANKLAGLGIFPDASRRRTAAVASPAASVAAVASPTTSSASAFRAASEPDPVIPTIVPGASDNAPALTSDQVFREARRLATEYGVKISDLRHINGELWVNTVREYGPLPAKLRNLGFKFKVDQGWWIK